MGKELVKVYIYTRVSTVMQVDGFSLDAQKERIHAFCEYNGYSIAGEYEDAGRSGKSIEGRPEFTRMMNDIRTKNDGVSYVLVYKLSRFGRNAADVLSSLQIMQDYGVNLICVEDGIDSSKDAGKLMISVLSAVAEIERENIRVQTMEGRMQKAREGKWNGGFAPYGYSLVNGELVINEDEAPAIRTIFDLYVHTDMGSTAIEKYLDQHDIRKIPRQNGKNELFTADFIRKILSNPVYAGKIAFGRRRTEKVNGTRNDYRVKKQKDYLLADGMQEAVIDEDTWNAAQVKLLDQAYKYKRINSPKDNRVHLLSNLLKCPICGAGMYGNKTVKHRKDGTKYKDYFFYCCKHRTMHNGVRCDYSKQIPEDVLDQAVVEVIGKLVSKPQFADYMREKIHSEIDTSSIEEEIQTYQKQYRKSVALKENLLSELDELDPFDKHYEDMKKDLNARLYRMYDKIDEYEKLIHDASLRKAAILEQRVSAENIYKILCNFDSFFAMASGRERRDLLEALVKDIYIHEEKTKRGQWLKAIRFRLPIIKEDMVISSDNKEGTETVCLMSRIK